MGEIYITHNDNSLNLAIIRFGPNLKKLYTGLARNELEKLKMIFNSYQDLESIRVLH